MYIAIKDDIVIGREETLVDLCKQIMRVRIDDTGRVYTENEMDSVSYDLNQWTRTEALSDFARTRMKCILPRGVQVYGCTKI